MFAFHKSELNTLLIWKALESWFEISKSRWFFYGTGGDRNLNLFRLTLQAQLVFWLDWFSSFYFEGYFPLTVDEKILFYIIIRQDNSLLSFTLYLFNKPANRSQWLVDWKLPYVNNKYNIQDTHMPLLYSSSSVDFFSYHCYKYLKVMAAT